MNEDDHCPWVDRYVICDRDCENCILNSRLEQERNTNMAHGVPDQSAGNS